MQHIAAIHGKLEQMEVLAKEVRDLVGKDRKALEARGLRWPLAFDFTTDDTWRYLCGDRGYVSPTEQLETLNSAAVGTLPFPSKVA